MEGRGNLAGSPLCGRQAEPDTPPLGPGPSGLPWSEALLLCGWGWGEGGAYKVGVDEDIGFLSEKCHNLVLSRNGRVRINSFSGHSLSTYCVPGCMPTCQLAQKV